MSFAIAFPNIDPIIFSVGPLAIRWYGLAYLAGVLLGIQYIKAFAAKPPYAMDRKNADDFLIWVFLGIFLGGRLGYIAFYKAAFYLDHPLDILKVWEGGMSFHGGLIGVILAVILFCRQRKLSYWAVGDAVACATPIGLFFGRIANFINGELFGRISDVPWAMVFPHGGPLPRHPSQLYEAALEGLLLFIILFLLSKSDRWRLKAGFLSGVFMVGYAAARGFVELFRQPDAHIGFLFGTFTMGQLLSVPLVALGLYLIFRPEKTV
ncbi:MAG: prolipoprotein diacylglyceryl transferase [Rhodospirillaceae bacterium]|jgi:phosphatidylglycerol---prolipoprotein diacylglyceryl transferase|nr:prolipoprotein diacylglyceryl transferase [Rhodospirillaceae bacterium]MBT4590042.1 prolipoprotein diacylglyceryl transferase [Rhodospirillaceae bacterium]MBT4939964.1 prolipoprotein diacylglyceryl transferase [Rhodospirillaceae bacterium]MBT5939513.1 prolipoprotein diacylglyceryl transferase [Rhodospirillaceae bacterium]MBT7268007.1 prolipoprotein diacylglyceryl transferase [Rhodospirillaceae bacterium]